MDELGPAATVAEATALLSAKLGASAAAHLAARALIKAEILGEPRFGLDLLSEWSTGPVSESATGALQWRDCAGQFSPLAVAQAALDLAKIAAENGIGAIFLRGIKGFGRLAPFVREIADHGLVAVAATQGPAFVAPDGGESKAIGTNPIAFAAGSGRDRIVIDIATAAATMAALKAARESGATLPEDVALDASGAPTNVAEKVAALLPKGGRIGSAVGLVVEVLAGAISLGRDDPNGRGVFLLAIDPARTGDDAWAAKLATLAGEWRKAGGHWPGGRPVDDGTPLPDHVATRLTAALRKL